jgi:hypothetical protein
MSSWCTAQCSAVVPSASGASTSAPSPISDSAAEVAFDFAAATSASVPVAAAAAKAAKTAPRAHMDRGAKQLRRGRSLRPEVI